MTEKMYAVYHIECGVMQDISVFKNKEKAEEYYEDLIRANYPDEAEDIINNQHGQYGGRTIHHKPINSNDIQELEVDDDIGWQSVEIKE
jgi:hypothetical protein